MKIMQPILAWLIALVMLVGAAHELRHQRALTVSGTQAMPLPQWQKQALNEEDYQAIRKLIALFGSLTLEASGEGLLLRAGQLSDYAAWRLVLDQILLEHAGIDWKISYLCSGQCEKGDAHRVRLQGMRRVLKQGE